MSAFELPLNTPQKGVVRNFAARWLTLSGMKRDLARRLKLHHLRVMVAVSDKGSLLKAAAFLGLTQPAVTRSLHEIEMVVGTRLFERHAKGVLPTDIGAQVIASAKRVLAELEALEREIDAQLKPDESAIAVGALPAAAIGVLPGAIAQLHAKFPKVRVHIKQGQTDELLNALTAGDVQLMVGRLYPQISEKFECVELYQDTVALLARADHPIFRESSLESLRSYEVVLTTNPPNAAAEIEELMQQLNLRRAMYLESNSLPLVREILLSTDMVSILPRLMMAGDLLRGTVREIMALPLAGGRPCGLILLRDAKLSKSAQLFVDILREHVNKLAATSLSHLLSVEANQK